MNSAAQRSKRVQRNVKDVIMLLVVTALGGLLLYQHIRLQKAVDLIFQLSSLVPGSN